MKTTKWLGLVTGMGCANGAGIGLHAIQLG
jgi:hypothetical protein